MGDVVRLLHRAQDFDSSVQISPHQVGGADEDFGRAAIFKVVDSAVLQESADDGDDGNVFAQSIHSGSQTADSSDNELYLDSSFTRDVESVDYFWIDQGIELEDNPTLAIFSVGLDLGLDAYEDSFAQVNRRDEQLSVRGLLAKSREVVEQLGNVLSYRRVLGEQRQVGV